MNSDEKYELIWNKICGECSPLALMSCTEELSHLVSNLVGEIVEDDSFEAFATFDESTKFPLIAISTGCFDKINSTCTQGLIEIANDYEIANENQPIWTELGYNKESFETSQQFSAHICDLVFDFIVFHELGHIIRGHLDGYSTDKNDIAVAIFETQASDLTPLSGLQRIALGINWVGVKLSKRSPPWC